jgi:general secretion pathway protein G
MTILELMIVLVILSLIGMVGAVQVMQQLDRAKVDVARLQLRQLENALTLLQLDVRRYPTAEEGLALLVENAGNVEGWRGPYIKGRDLLQDPWGQMLAYEVDGSGAVNIRSLGSDRKSGGEGAAADLLWSGAT